MLGMLKRHEVEVLLKAGHSQAEVARLTEVGLRSVQRLAKEVPVVHVDDAAERKQRRIGRPNVVAIYPGQFGRGREGGKFGANSGAASSGLGWTSVVVRVRPAEDHRCGMGEERESDEMEFGLCLRNAGDRHRCGAVLALSTAAKRKRRKLGGLREVFFLQGPQVLR